MCWIVLIRKAVLKLERDLGPRPVHQPDQDIWIIEQISESEAAEMAAEQRLRMKDDCVS